MSVSGVCVVCVCMGVMECVVYECVCVGMYGVCLEVALKQ